MNLSKKIYKSKASRKTLMKKADEVFSLYIRTRDARKETKLPPDVGRCITCNQPTPIKRGHCGHYIGRQHQATRYHERNCHLQCVSCNTFEEGRHYLYGKIINERYGPKMAEHLDALGHTFCHRNRFDFMVIIDTYQDKLNEL